MKDDKGTWVITKRNILFLPGIWGGTKRQYLTQKIIFQNYRSNLYLASFMDFARDWDQFQEFPHLTLSLPPYAQVRIQEQEIQ